MALEGQEISNPRTGQRMTFVELRKEVLRIESLNPPTGEREPAHVHPKQKSGAEVVSGSLAFESLASSIGWVLATRSGFRPTRRTAFGTTAANPLARSSSSNLHSTSPLSSRRCSRSQHKASSTGRECRDRCSWPLWALHLATRSGRFSRHGRYCGRSRRCSVLSHACVATPPAFPPSSAPGPERHVLNGATLARIPPDRAGSAGLRGRSMAES